MSAKILTYREYVETQKKRAEKRMIRKKIADLLFDFFVRLVVVLLGMGILFGIYILLCAIMGPIFGMNLLQSDKEAEQQYQNELAVEYAFEEVER